MTQEQVQRAIDRLNHRPRKVLGFRSPHEVFFFTSLRYSPDIMAGKHLNKPIVALAPTSDGKGFWLVGADGGVFPFGDALGYGSLGSTPLNAPVVAGVGVAGVV